MSQSWCLTKKKAFEFFRKLARKLKLPDRYDAGWYVTLKAIFDDELSLDNFRYGLYVIRKYATVSRHGAPKGPRLWGYEMVLSKNNWIFYTGDYMPKLHVHDYKCLSELRDDVEKYEALMMNLGFGFRAPAYVISELRKYAFSQGINFLYKVRGKSIVVITRDRLDELYQYAVDVIRLHDKKANVDNVVRFFLAPIYELSFFVDDGTYVLRSRSIDFIMQYIPHAEPGVCAYCGFPFTSNDTPIQFSLYFVRRGVYRFVRSGYVHRMCIDKMLRSKGLLKFTFKR